MEERRPRERELVLAPNEYAYVLDSTKGHINSYVGPNKTSLAQTDEPVVFEAESKRFVSAPLERAVQLFATAPANWYVQLKNPARDGSHPIAGTANSSAELQIGRKINLAGPISFALWPGQLAKVIAGHRIQRNQYVLIRIYDAEAASADPAAALGRPGDASLAEVRFAIGERRAIRGTDCAFFIPPDGVEVLADERGRYVRDAVTLGRLQYCVLLTEDGYERYVRGEAVVFPAPDEQLIEREGMTVFSAIELSEVTGIYVKVIAPYTDEQGVEHKEGEELFITGESKLYFPRAEHAIIRYGAHELYQAIAIPRGEGRYVLDRKTGEVRLVEGPRMFLPDPRREVIVRRALEAAERALYVPRAAGLPPLFLGEAPPIEEPQAASPSPLEHDERAGAALRRSDSFTPPRTLVLDDGGDGAIAVQVSTGYAVQLIDSACARRVVQGPKRLLLGYDETLQPLCLSTGTPKSADRKLTTAFLQLAGNKVSDRVAIVAADLVRAELLLQYRVDFEGESERWFAVEDYVELLCGQASSLIKAAARQLPIHELRARITDVVHETLLGTADEQGHRPGLLFAENGMRVFDVEVFEFEVADEDVATLLSDAQEHAVRNAIEVIEREATLGKRRRVAAIERELAQQSHELALEALARRAEEARCAHDLALQEHARKLALVEAELDGKRQAHELERELLVTRLEMRRQEDSADLMHRGELQELHLTELEARARATVAQAQAFSPQLVEALNRLGDEQFLAALAQNFGELAAVEGKGLLETARKFLDFIPSSVVPTLRAHHEPEGAEKVS